MADTKINVAFERLFDLAAIAQCLLFSRASHSHTTRTWTPKPNENFFDMCQERAWGFKNQKELILTPSLNKNSNDGHVLLIFSIIFHQIPDESSSHLLAPVRQLNNGKQKSIHDCTIATSTQEPETMLHRNEPLPRQPLFQQCSFWLDASPALHFCWGKDYVSTMGGNSTLSACFICVSGKSQWCLTPASICVIAIITRHLRRPTHVQPVTTSTSGVLENQ